MDPGVRLIRHFRHDEQIVPSERVGVFPLLPVPVKAGKGGVVTDTVLGVIFPDGSFDGSQPDLMDWFVFWHKKVSFLEVRRTRAMFHRINLRCLRTTVGVKSKEFSTFAC